MQDPVLVSAVPDFPNCTVSFYILKLLKARYLLIKSAVVSVKDYKTCSPLYDITTAQTGTEAPK